MNDTGVPLIEARGLVKRFGEGEVAIEVLRSVDLVLEEGARVAVVGQSGVGKSTLLHILGTLDRPTEGEVLFRGEDVFVEGFHVPDRLEGLVERRLLVLEVDVFLHARRVVG